MKSSILVLTFLGGCGSSDCPEFSLMDIDNVTKCDIGLEMSKHNLIDPDGNCDGLNNDRCDYILRNNVSWKTSASENSVSNAITYYEFSTDNTWEVYSFLDISGNKYHEKRTGTFTTNQFDNLVNLTLSTSSCPSDETSILSVLDNSSNTFSVKRKQLSYTNMKFHIDRKDIDVELNRSNNLIGIIFGGFIEILIEAIATALVAPFTDEYWLDIFYGDLTSGHPDSELTTLLDSSTESCFSSNSFPSPTITIVDEEAYLEEVGRIQDSYDDLIDDLEDILDNLDEVNFPEEF